MALAVSILYNVAMLSSDPLVSLFFRCLFRSKPYKMFCLSVICVVNHTLNLNLEGMSTPSSLLGLQEVWMNHVCSV